MKKKTKEKNLLTCQVRWQPLAILHKEGKGKTKGALQSYCICLPRNSRGNFPPPDHQTQFKQPELPHLSSSTDWSLLYHTSLLHSDWVYEHTFHKLDCFIIISRNMCFFYWSYEILKFSDALNLGISWALSHTILNINIKVKTWTTSVCV